MSQVADFHSETPFVSQGEYSPEAVSLMRALRDLRGLSGAIESSPQQVLGALRSLGYRRQNSSFMSDQAEARLFGMAMQRFAQQNNVSYPTCEDVLAVIRELGYENQKLDSEDSGSGLPIDRRRLEFDDRQEPVERRSSLELSAQEKLDLTQEEHQFLDGLKELREHTGRGFASSEELLSIAWRLGYRPVDQSGCTQDWLNDNDRCLIQVAFTRAIESRIRTQNTDEFLTCRDVLAVIQEVGFRRV